MKYPKKTFIHYTPIDAGQQKFLNGLAEIFQAKDMSIRSVIEALLKWRTSIPESTKLSSSLSQEGRKFLIQIDSSKEPDKFLFSGIPSCFDKSGIHSKTNNNEIENNLIKLNNTKQEIDKVYKNLLLKIKADLITFIKFIDRQCLNNTLKSIPKNKLIKNFQDILSKVKDYPFSSNTSRFIGRALNFNPSNYNQYFLETMADVLTGSSPRHWDQKGYSKFEFAIKRVKTEIELACEIASPYFKGQSVLAFIDKGKQKKTFMKLGAMSNIDKHLTASIEKIKMILDSFDEIDKRKIILAIVESIDKKSPTADDLDFIETTNSGEPEINA